VETSLERLAPRRRWPRSEFPIPSPQVPCSQRRAILAIPCPPGCRDASPSLSRVEQQHSLIPHPSMTRVSTTRKTTSLIHGTASLPHSNQSLLFLWISGERVQTGILGFPSAWLVHSEDKGSSVFSPVTMCVQWAQPMKAFPDTWENKYDKDNLDNLAREERDSLFHLDNSGCGSAAVCRRSPPHPDWHTLTMHIQWSFSDRSVPTTATGDEHQI
jgi:hypothetical protein